MDVRNLKIAPEARYKNNRRWSASNASAEPAVTALPVSQPRTGLNKTVGIARHRSHWDYRVSSTPAGVACSFIATTAGSASATLPLHRRLLLWRASGADMEGGRPRPPQQAHSFGGQGRSPSTRLFLRRAFGIVGHRRSHFHVSHFTTPSAGGATQK